MKNEKLLKDAKEKLEACGSLDVLICRFEGISEEIANIEEELQNEKILLKDIKQEIKKILES